MKKQKQLKKQKPWKQCVISVFLFLLIFSLFGCEKEEGLLLNSSDLISTTTIHFADAGGIQNYYRLRISVNSVTNEYTSDNKGNITINDLPKDRLIQVKLYKDNKKEIYSTCFYFMNNDQGDFVHSEEDCYNFYITSSEKLYITFEVNDGSVSLKEFYNNSGR